MKILGKKEQSTLKPLEIPMPKVIPPKKESSEFLVILEAKAPLHPYDLEKIRMQVIEQMKQGNVITIPCGIGIKVVMLNGKGCSKSESRDRRRAEREVFREGRAKR